MLRMLAMFGLVLCGCNAPQDTLETASRSALPDQAWPVVMDAAEQTMREFFTVDSVDAVGGVIRALPTTETDSRSPTLLEPKLSSPAERRRLAELQVRRRDAEIVAACRILIQENQEAQARPFLQQKNAGDVPNQTPLEESRGLEMPGVSWITVGRDRQLEQAVLAALRERLEK